MAIPDRARGRIRGREVSLAPAVVLSTSIHALAAAWLTGQVFAPARVSVTSSGGGAGITFTLRWDRASDGPDVHERAASSADLFLESEKASPPDSSSMPVPSDGSVLAAPARTPLLESPTAPALLPAPMRVEIAEVPVPDPRELARPEAPAEPAFQVQERRAPEAGSGGAGGVSSLARAGAFRNPPPPYPALARQRGWKGTVILRVEVLADGTAGTIQVVASSGHEVLDEAATAAVRRWRFEPARTNGMAVASHLEIPIRFELDRKA